MAMYLINGGQNRELMNYYDNNFSKSLHNVELFFTYGKFGENPLRSIVLNFDKRLILQA